MDWLLSIMASTALGAVLLFCVSVFGIGSITVVAAIKINQAQEKYSVRKSWLWRAALYVIDALIALFAIAYLFGFLFLVMFMLVFIREPLILERQMLLIFSFSVFWLIKTYWIERKILGKVIRSMAQTERERWPETKQSWRNLFERTKSLL